MPEGHLQRGSEFEVWEGGFRSFQRRWPYIILGACGEYKISDISFQDWVSVVCGGVKETFSRAAAAAETVATTKHDGGN